MSYLALHRRLESKLFFYSYIVYVAAGFLFAQTGALAVAQSVYTWNGTSDSAPPWLDSGNWTGGPASTWPGVLTAPNASAGNANDIAVFGPGSGARAYGSVGIQLNSGNGATLSLGTISATGTRSLIIGESAGGNLGTRDLVLNGAVAGNAAGLTAKTLLSITNGDMLIRPNTGGGNPSSPLGLKLGITDGVVNVNNGTTIEIMVAISEANANSGFTKTGAGILVLSGTSAFTGGVTISGGTVKLATAAALGAASSVTLMSGGTLLLSGSSATSDRINNAAAVTMNGGGTLVTGGLSEGVRPTGPMAGNGAAGLGALTLQNTTSLARATVDFDPDSLGSSLAFSNLLGGAGAFVNIINWTGLPLTDNGNTANDRLLLASDPGLSATQLANYAFYNDAGGLIATGGQIISYGNMFEIVPIAESETWVAGGLALAASLPSLRRRWRRVAASQRSDNRRQMSEKRTERIESAKDLKVYKLAYELAMEIFKLTKKFPSDEKRALTSQIRRSSRSICLNLREAGSAP
jgi:autotransporter-associated beta strand protein